MDTLRKMTHKPSFGRVFEAGRSSSVSPTGTGLKSDQLLSDMSDELEAKNLEIANLRREMRQKEETTQQRMHLAMSQHEARSHAAVQQAQDEVAKLKRYVSRLEQQKQDHVREHSREVQDLREEISVLQERAASVDRLQAELQASPGKQRQLERLSKELERLEPEKEELEREVERLRARVEAIPLLEEQVRLFQEKATAAEFAAGELSLAAAMQQDEVESLRAQLESSASVDLSARRPTPTSQPASISNLEDLLLSPMASPMNSFSAEPSLGDQMEFLELSNEDDEVDNSETKDSSNDYKSQIARLTMDLDDKNDALEEKQRIIDHLEQAQASVVAASHRMQREVSQLRLQVQQLQEDAEANGHGSPATSKQESPSSLARKTIIPSVDVKLVNAVKRAAAAEKANSLTFPTLRNAVVKELGRKLEPSERLYVRGFAEAAASLDGREFARLRRANTSLREELDVANANAAANGATFGSAPVLLDGHLFVPDGVVVDGYQGNAAVRRITMGSNVSVAPYSFLACPNLVSIVCGGQTNLGTSNFSDCPLLASVTIGEKLTCSDGAFQGCTALECVSLGPAATLGQNLPQRFYLAAGGKITDAGSDSATTADASDGDLAAVVAKLTREIDFLTQGVKVKDEMLSEIQRDARAALMPSLTKELELSKLSGARLRWQIALLTTRCKSLKSDIAEHEARLTDLGVENEQMRTELATALRVIQSCPVAKILEQQRERKRRKKQREKRKARGHKSPRHARTRSHSSRKKREGAEEAPATAVVEGTSTSDKVSACECGEHETKDSHGEAAGQSDKVQPSLASAKTVEEAARVAAAERVALEKSSRALENAEREEKRARRAKFLGYMRDAIDKDDFKDYFEAAFENCVDVVQLRGKSSYGYQYSYEGEVNASGKPHGLGRAVFDKKKHGVYVGEFDEGLFHGRGTRDQPQGCYTGSWERGKLHGQGTLWTADGKEGFSGQWENSKPVIANSGARPV